MADMLPAELAAQLSPHEMTRLAYKVEQKYHQKYGVIKITRSKTGLSVLIETEDKVRHVVVLNG